MPGRVRRPLDTARAPAPALARPSPAHAALAPRAPRRRSRPGVFPEADKDPVIQIANHVTCQGSDKPIVKNVFTLKECAPISGAQALSWIGLGFA